MGSVTEGPDGLLVVPGQEVREALAGMETEVIGAVRAAYLAHAAGASELPHSTFVRIPHTDRGRVIALPGYLGEPAEVLGIKWIASFPQNVGRGLERASAVIVLNSTATGHPQVIMEGAEISAARTAASAALAAACLAPPGDSLGVIGAGRISREIVRYLKVAVPRLTRVAVFDIDDARARQFARACAADFGAQVEVASSLDTVLGSAATTVIATSAVLPYVHDLAGGTARTLLHISLRDLAPALIARCRNIVDDLDHVCREGTSIHLAFQQEGGTGFVAGTLADVLNNVVPGRETADDTVVFSPFGLAVLDLAVAALVRRRVAEHGGGTVIPHFVSPPAWPGGC